jgi:protein TonB
MTRSAKPALKRVHFEDPRMGRVVNDNIPMPVPGHMLSDLGDSHHQSHTEDVAIAADEALIAAFPSHQLQSAAVAAPSMDAVPERHARHVPPARKRVTWACLGSMFFHVALFAALVMSVVATPDEPVEEAGEAVSVVMLGDSDVDRMSAGDKSKEPAPEEVVADAVQPDVVQPTAADPTEAAPVEAPPPETVSNATAEPVQQVSPEAVVSTEPEILTSSVPAEQSVVQPMVTEVQSAEVPPAPIPPSAFQPTEQPVETAAVVPEQAPAAEVTPVTKPPAKPIGRPKSIAKKQPPKQVKVKAGSDGSSEADSKRGSSEGSDSARSDHNSASASDQSGAGGAAVANYPGKVGSRIRRSVRVPAEYKRMAALMNVRVHLTIGAGGDLTSLSVVRSSGIPELDSAVTEGVRRAAPFPPLPSEWGKASWSFTQEVQVTGN